MNNQHVKVLNRVRALLGSPATEGPTKEQLAAWVAEANTLNWCSAGIRDHVHAMAAEIKRLRGLL